MNPGVRYTATVSELASRIEALTARCDQELDRTNQLRIYVACSLVGNAVTAVMAVAALIWR